MMLYIQSLPLPALLKFAEAVTMDYIRDYAGYAPSKLEDPMVIHPSSSAVE
jgi:hypothetical protein